jgi:hypothetical protein
MAWSTRLVLAALATCSGCNGQRDAAEPDAVDAAPEDATLEEASLSVDATALVDGSRPDAAPRLSELVETLFVPTCVLGRCHTTSVPAGELSFTGRRISVHAALVNAASSEQPQRMRVVPFDPDASYLMEKLTSEQPAVGTSMPPMGLLPEDYIDRIRAWIAAGALDN